MKTSALKLQISIVVLACALAGCGTSRSTLRAQAQDHFLQGQFAQAEQDTIQPDVIAESKNRLLTLLELGTFAHYQGDYEKSNIYFFRAKDLARRLYTTSIREQIATGLLNDNAASYVGMDYEISLLHYYITTNFLLMSQVNKLHSWTMPEIKEGKTLIFSAQSAPDKILSDHDRSDALNKARSELLDWNSFLDEVRSRNRGQPYYKDDLLNKVFAAYIHRLIGTSRDNNIAHILYRDANDILVKAYSSYPTFNTLSQDYVDNYAKFSALGVDAVKETYIQATPFYSDTEKQINESKKHQGNVLFLLEDGIVPTKQERRLVIGLTTLFNEIKDPELRRSVEQIGSQLILTLAPDLGLAFFGATVVGAATGSSANGGRPQYISEAVDSAIGFEFKLPSIENRKITTSYTLKFVRDGDAKEFTSPVAIMSPLSDIAKLNVDRRANSVAFKTGIRVGLKYLAALVPAIIAYDKVNGPKLIKNLAATGVWMVGKKVIDTTEAADLRAWNLLPQWIGLSELTLPNGIYKIFAVRQSDGHSFPMGEVNISSEKTHVVLKGRIFSDNVIAKSPEGNIIN